MLSGLRRRVVWEVGSNVSESEIEAACSSETSVSVYMTTAF
jgi:hypothetical protein